MTGPRVALYGVDRPLWYVRRRGIGWTRVGFCPCCYSSPPRPHCPICRGEYKYGPLLPEATRRAWRDAWLDRCRRVSVLGRAALRGDEGGGA